MKKEYSYPAVIAGGYDGGRLWVANFPGMSGCWAATMCKQTADCAPKLEVKTIWPGNCSKPQATRRSAFADSISRFMAARSNHGWESLAGNLDCAVA